MNRKDTNRLIDQKLSDQRVIDQVYIDRGIVNQGLIDQAVFDKMETEFPNWGGLNARQKADLIRGCLSYHKHYEYLMDWYVRGRRLDASKRRISVMRAEINAESRQNTKDTLHSLSTLDGKIEASCNIEPSEKLFSMLAD